MTFTPAGGTFTSPSLSVMIQWCDDESLIAGSRQIWFNGADVTSSFSFIWTAGTTECPVRAESQATVTLVTGNNTLAARIENDLGNIGYNETLYSLNATPTVTITPGTGTLFGPSPSVTIKWCDDTSLSASSRRITFNGVDVTSNFTYVTQTSAFGCTERAESQGTVTLNLGSNTLEASISDGVTTGSRAVTYVYDDKPPPQISTAPHNGDILSPALCAACFDLIYTYSTPAYFTLDAPRSVTLFYSSYQAAPRALVQLDVWNPPENPNPPEMMSISLKRPDGTFVTFTNGLDEIFYTYGTNGTARLAAQLDASSLPSGAYAYTAVVRSWWSSTTEETTVPIRVLVQNERESHVAAGWTIAGMHTLIPQGDTLVVLLDGAGTITAFTRVATDRFKAPRADFTEIRKTAVGTYVRLWPDSTKAFFSQKVDGAVRVDSMKDRFGNVTRLTYSASDGKLTQTTDPMGKKITFGYTADWNGLWTIETGVSFLIKSKPGRKTTLTGNATTRDLLSFQDPDGLSQSFAYDSLHRMVQSSDREQATTDYTYDFSGALCRVTLAQVTLFDASQVRPSVNLVSPARTALPPTGDGCDFLWFPFDGTSSNPAARIAPDSVYGLTIGPRSDTTRMWFNLLGQPTKVVDAVGRTTQVSYNRHGQETTVTLPSGQQTIRQWTGGHLMSESVVGLNSFSYTYEPRYGLPQEVRQQGTLLSTNYYSAVGTLDSVRIGTFAQVIQHHADARGRDTLVVDQAGHRTRYAYDAVTGNLAQTVRDGGRTTTRRFDAFGRDFLAITPTNDTTRFAYDDVNRLVAVYDPVNPNPTITHYGPIYADSLTDPKGGRYRFVHDVLGWVTERYGPASATNPDRFGYDAAGNVVRWTNRNGQAVQYSLDLLGRTTQVVAPDRTLDFGYDPTGQDRFVWGKNAWSTDTTWLTPWGAVDSTKTARGLAVYGVGYDYAHWSGQPMAIRDGYNNRTIAFRYNDQGQQDTMFVRGQKTWVDTRNSDRLTSTRRYPALFSHKLNYTTDHSRAEIRWENSSGTALMSRVLGFDEAERINDNDVEGSSRYKYEYDRLGRLLRREIYVSGQECTYSPFSPYIICQGTIDLQSADTFTYDPVGNRTDHAAQIDPGSRLRRIAVHGDTVLYTHDGAGNVTLREERISGKVQELHWSALSQLDSVVTTQGATTTRSRYRYDAFGRRIRQENDGTSIEYVWTADGHVLFDIKVSTVSEYSYLPGTDRLHALYRGGQFHYYLTDHLGSVAKVADSTAAVKNRYTYDPWGWTESASEQVENRFRFTGREFDAETGLYYVRARYYDSACGRFISEDPIGLAGGLNPYAYASNNPVSIRDPSGLGGDCGRWEVTGHTRVCINGSCSDWEPVWTWREMECPPEPGDPRPPDPRGGSGGGGGSNGGGGDGGGGSDGDGGNGDGGDEGRQRQQRCRTFGHYAPQLNWSTWRPVAAHVGSVAYTITAEPVGSTSLTNEVGYFGQNDWVQGQFKGATAIVTGNSIAHVYVRHRGNPYGSAVRVTVCP